jgi:phosphoribosylformylglycinamidine synthase subunit PurL
MREIHAAGLAESAHDLSDGGLAVTVAECCRSVGALLELESDLPLEHLLFCEAPSRILISSSRRESVSEIAAKFGVECERIGTTMKERLRIQNGFVTYIDCDLSELQFDLPSI